MSVARTADVAQTFARLLRGTMLVVSSAAAVCIAIAVAGSGVLFIATEDADYFPGDPAAADLLLLFALAGWLLIAPVVGFHIARRHDPGKGIRLSRWLVLGAVTLSLVAASPVVFSVARRNFGAWAELKEKLIAAKKTVVEQVGPVDRLSDAEMAKADAWLQAHPVFHTLDASKAPVQIRVMRRTPPFVGVDFGSGQNAVFDLTTMYCIYSD